MHQYRENFSFTLRDNNNNNNNNNNNKNNNNDFYSAISVGSWRFTTEYFKLKILQIEKFVSIMKRKYIKIQIKNAYLKIKIKTKD